MSPLFFLIPILYIFTSSLYFAGCLHPAAPGAPHSAGPDRSHREQVQNQRDKHQVPVPQEQGRDCGQGG